MASEDRDGPGNPNLRNINDSPGQFQGVVGAKVYLDTPFVLDLV